MKSQSAKALLVAACGILSLISSRAYACCTCPAIDVIEIISCNNGKGCFADVSSTGCNSNDKKGCEVCTVENKLCCGYKPYTQGVGLSACPTSGGGGGPHCGGHPCSSVPKSLNGALFTRALRKSCRTRSASRPRLEPMPHCTDHRQPTLQLCAVLILCSTCFGQAVPRTAALKIVSVEKTSEIASSLVIPAKCDLAGNAWVRIAGDKVGAGPILRISPDGKTLVKYTLDAIPPEVAADARIRSFAPGAGDELVVLLEKQGEETQHYLVRYGSDGEFRSSSRLDAPLRPSFLGTFPSGDLLIGGDELPPDPKTLPAGTPISPNLKGFVGIFNNRGLLLRRIALKGDLKPKDQKAKNPAGDPYFKQDIEYRTAIVLSSAETGEDGNVYLMRNTPTGPVYVISPSGTVYKSISLIPPRARPVSARPK
jgi:hypothetical protein